MAEVNEKIIADIGDGNFEAGVRWLALEGIYVYQDNRDGWRYYLGQKATEEECKTADIHPVIVPWMDNPFSWVK